MTAFEVTQSDHGFCIVVSTTVTRVGVSLRLLLRKSVASLEYVLSDQLSVSYRLAIIVIHHR